MCAFRGSWVDPSNLPLFRGSRGYFEAFPLVVPLDGHQDGLVGEKLKVTERPLRGAWTDPCVVRGARAARRRPQTAPWTVFHDVPLM